MFAGFTLIFIQANIKCVNNLFTRIHLKKKEKSNISCAFFLFMYNRPNTGSLGLVCILLTIIYWFLECFFFLHMYRVSMTIGQLFTEERILT